MLRLVIKIIVPSETFAQDNKSKTNSMELILIVHLIWVVTLSCLLFLYVIKSDIGRYFLMVFFAFTTLLIGMHLDRGQEYEIKLINQNKVEIKSFITGKTYYVMPEKITETIDKDNL